MDILGILSSLSTEKMAKNGISRVIGSGDRLRTHTKDSTIETQIKFDLLVDIIGDLKLEEE